MTENTLPATMSDVSNEQLLALTGQSSGPKFTDFPRLSMNRDGVDEQERQLPVGHFVVSQGGVAVYGKPVSFRPFINAYQYAIYNSDEKKYTNRSVIIKSFSEEALDEQGGIACGKIPAKKREGLTEKQLAEQKLIKCYRILYGLVTFDGVTADGDKVNVDNVAVKMRLSGDNFMPVQETLDKLSKAKIPMLTTNLNVTTERQVNGATKWYRAIFKADLKSPQITLQDVDWDFLRSFQDSIERENGFIVEKYKAAKKFTVEAGSENEVIEALEKDLLDDSELLEQIGR
jgi:hypothetical protein